MAGAAFTNITPKNPQFLYGYPFVERTSTGIHDWLLSSALYISDGGTQTIFIANDVIYVSKSSVARIRKAVSKETSVPEENIMIAGTHTHSGPITVDCVISEEDKVVPPVDNEYVAYLESKIIEAACHAYENAVPAEFGFFHADGTGVGTNRHDIYGPSDMDIPVMVVRRLDDKEYIACLLVCAMHPTVLHEDSKLISGDFPGLAREQLQKNFLMSECPVLYFTGAAGNQSPRHVTKENTFAEAWRIGGIIAKAVGEKIISGGLTYSDELSVSCSGKLIDLPKRKFQSVAYAEKHLQETRAEMDRQKKISDKTKEFRTAEVDWFGAVESLLLAKKAEAKQLGKVYDACLPAEIQVIRVGDWKFVAWPGEIFVEYALDLKSKSDNTFLITIANGELQGYIVTEEAVEKGFYEAGNSFFDHTAGRVLVDKTLELL